MTEENEQTEGVEVRPEPPPEPQSDIKRLVELIVSPISSAKSILKVRGIPVPINSVLVNQNSLSNELIVSIPLSAVRIAGN